MKCVWCETNEADGVCNDGNPPYCLECQEMLQEHMGRKNDMMPICPHCREKIDLEKLANGVWVRKQ